MAQKSKGPGIQSAAGLIRYYDTEEDSAIKIRPTVVIVLSGIVAVGALMLRYLVAY